MVGVHQYPLFPSLPAAGPFDDAIETIPLHEYLALKRLCPPRTLQREYAQGPVVVQGGEAVSYARGTPLMIPAWPRCAPPPFRVSRKHDLLGWTAAST